MLNTCLLSSSLSQALANVPSANRRPLLYIYTSIDAATTKIINTSSQARVLPDYDQGIEERIREYQVLVGLTTPINPSLLSRDSKYRYMTSLTRFYSELYRAKIVQEYTEERIKHSNASFSCFLALPLELQDQIWEHTMASDLKPRVHCVMERKSEFVSNQSISPLLHVCARSRQLYLSKTCALPAFQTYINFELDTIYLFEGYDTSSGDVTRFCKFLKSSPAEYIRKLAMSKEL